MKKKKLMAAITLLGTAAVTMTGAYALGCFTTDDSSGYIDLSQVEKEETKEGSTQKDTVEEEPVAVNNSKSVKNTTEEFGMDNVMDATDEYNKEQAKEETAKETTQETKKEIEKEAKNTSEDSKEQTSGEIEETKQVVASETVSAGVGNFNEESKIALPVQGTVAIDYSMDSTTYFATLDQYKYNPAMVIGCAEGTDVVTVATGTVTSISQEPETGMTVTMDIGNGYKAIYGQLSQVNCTEGKTMNQGEVLGKIGKTSRYYSKEGDNLYFKMTKDDVPVDPKDYLQE